MRTTGTERGNANRSRRQASVGVAGLPWRRGWLTVAALVCLQSSAWGQVAAAATPASPSDTSHAKRCLAAIDLAIIAAESGIVDVSIEAMRRATRKGPPVASIELGGLLSNKPNPRSRSSPGTTANFEALSAQAKLAARLHRLHRIWKKRQVDPALAYEAFKSLILPESRPNEAFCYSVVAVNRQATNYSNLDFDVEKPKLQDSGAAALVEWARLADAEDDLLRVVRQREKLPAAASAALLVRVMLAQDETRPAADAIALCEALAARAKALISAPDAELLFGHVWKMLDRVEPDAAARQDLTDAVLHALEREQNWASNQWLLFLVAKGLRNSLDEGDAQQFRRYADIAMSRYNSIRANNAEYVTSREAAMYGEAAKRAFAAGHVKLATDCMRSQSLLPVSQSYLESQANAILDPTQAVAQALLKMDRAERYELLKSLVWTMPQLGLSGGARMNARDLVPQVFQPASPGEAALWRGVAGVGARSASLLEWTMRDAIALGKQAEIADEIAKLEAKASDDAKLARLVLSLAQDLPADLALLTKPADDGTKALIPTMGQTGPLTPLDIDVVEQALAQEEYRAAGVKLVDQLLAIAVERHQDPYVTLAREIKFRLRASEPAATHRDLAHWVVSDDVAQSHFIDGHVPTSLWIKRDDGDTWGHQYGTHFSNLLLRYPLQGNYSISFRTLDGTYLEGAATLGGRIIEFLEYRSNLRLWGIGRRRTKGLETDAFQADKFNAIRLDRKEDKLTIHVGDDFEKELAAPAGDFPFFGMGAYHYRETSFDSLKIEGDVTIPRSVEMLSPSLLGWSARFTNQRLPDLTLLPEDTPARDDDGKINYDWRLVNGALESVDHEKIDDPEVDKNPKADKYARPRREALIRYMRPLCDGEQISLQFYHEPGKYSLAPALGRIAMLLSDAEVALHWITTDPSGTTTGIDDANRIVDEQAQQLTAVGLKENDWNQLTLGLEGEVVTLSINGEAVYRRSWEAGVGRQFGLFHDPTQYHVRVRNVRLSGDWPERLPGDLFELKPKQKPTSAR